MPTRIAMVAPSAAICASARSTKITPRSTTCTPRYACIPVRIRLATNGQIRKGRISIGLLEPLLRRLECLAQQSNIVIKQFEVVRHVFFAAHRRQVLDDLPTRFASNSLRSFQVEIRLNQDQLAILPLHQPNQLNGMAGCGGNSRSWLHVSDYIQPEMLRKVGERIVIGHDLAPAIGLHVRVPLLFRGSQTLVEVLEALLVVR